MLTQTAALLAGAAGVWWLREEVVWPAPRPRFAAGPDGGGWLPFLDGPELVAVAAGAAGRLAGALVDSGAQTSVIDRAAAERLGVQLGPPIPMLAYGVSGRPQVGRAGTLDVSLGRLALPRLRMAVLDLSPIVEATRGRVELVIGQDVLRRTALHLDLRRRRLAFHPSGAPLPDADLRPAPARLHGRELLAPVSVEGHALEAVVDTGSSAPLALSERAARAAGLLAEGRPVRVEEGITFGGAGRNRVVTAETLSVAGLPPIRRAPVQIYDGQAVGLLPDGLIGVGALRDMRVWMDLGRGALAFASPQPAARSTAASSQNALSGRYSGGT